MTNRTTYYPLDLCLRIYDSTASYRLVHDERYPEFLGYWFKEWKGESKEPTREQLIDIGKNVVTRYRLGSLAVKAIIEATHERYAEHNVKLDELIDAVINAADGIRAINTSIEALIERLQALENRVFGNDSGNEGGNENEEEEQEEQQEEEQTTQAEADLVAINEVRIDEGQVVSEGRGWDDGYRATNSISKEGESVEFEWSKNKGVIGVTSEPTANPTWRNVLFGAYVFRDSELIPRTDNTFLSSRFGADKARITINNDRKLELYLAKAGEDLELVHTSKNAIGDIKLYPYGIFGSDGMTVQNIKLLTK